MLTDGELTQQQTVDNALEHIRSIQAEYVVPDLAGLPEMTGGLVGYFGYETVGYIEPKLKFCRQT